MVTNETGSAFAAISHPIRRALLDLVRDAELCAGELAERFPVSRPAIARHVRVLRRAGLLRERRAGPSRFYSLDPAALGEVDQWLAPYRLFWAARLTELKHAVESDPTAFDPTQRSERGDLE